VGAEDGSAGENTRWFVGREDVLEAILGFLDEQGRGYRMRTGGTWGIGKTWLVDELHARAQDRAVVLHVKSGAYVPSASAEGATPETLDVVRNWNSYARILAKLVDSAPDTERWGALAEKTRAAQAAVIEVRPPPLTFAPEIEAGRDVVAKDEARIASPTIYQEEPLERLQATIDTQRNLLEQAFAETVDDAGRTSGAVILVDEFDRLRGYPVADWLLQLVTAPKHAVVVVATRVAADEEAADTQAFERRDLEPFGKREVGLYLEHRLGKEAVEDALVDRVLRFSGGLPQAVGMAADLIEQRRHTGGELLLEDVSVDPSTATTELLCTIVRELPEEDVRQLLKESRFARRIDADLIHYLLCGMPYEEGSAEQRKRADTALAKLRDYSFVEEYEGDAADLGRLRFHEYITRAQAPPNDPTLDIDEEGVHAELAAYYEQRLDDFEEERSGETAYMQLYKLESPSWQALMREWLFHMSRLDRRETRERARLAFARVFLQTFWWYRCYVRYDVCDELVADWARLQPRVEALTARFRDLLAAYPLGYEKLDAGDWAKVEQVMRTLRDDLGLDARIPLDDQGVDDERARKHLSNRRWVRALTSLFRAHSYRYRTGKGELAPRFFDDALEYFKAEDDPSAVAWATFEYAELKLELGDAAGAAKLLRESAKLLEEACEEDEENRDYELMANLQRLHGDIAAAGEDWDEAVDATARAVLRAYTFLDEPQPPDAYTVAFYGEMRERAAQRLLEVRELGGPEAAAKAAARLLEQLAILRGPFGLEDGAGKALEVGDREALVALLPPPPSALGEAAREDETFAETTQRVFQAVQQDPSDAKLAAPKR